MFFALDIIYHFICDEKNLFLNIEICHKFMSVIIRRRIRGTTNPQFDRDSQ